MNVYETSSRSRTDQGPAIYYGYCNRTGRYRMMDLPEYASNVQAGMSRLMSDAQAAYEDLARGFYGGTNQTGARRSQRPRDGDCRNSACPDCACPDCACPDGGRDCHCECCVEDADVLVHARCGEVRRIPVTFENDSRREKPVTLELEKFVTAGGRDVKWAATLSEASFTLKPCSEHTVLVSVGVVCATDNPNTPADRPPTGPNDPAPPAGTAGTPTVTVAAGARLGTVDRCEVAYATLRAEGCLVRPVVLAVAVLPNDCDDYRRPCSCGCCH
jgi:hypothetical protein